MKRKGVLGVIVAAMRAYPKNDYLQEYCCGALEALAHIREFFV